MTSLRLGCVKYLNARPLVHGWRGAVEFGDPSTLCKRLANGEVNVALVSSFEFLRNPIYRIVDDISISSDGPVYSVVVAHHGHISELQAIDLDPASETAANLLHCLLAELRLNIKLTPSKKFGDDVQRQASATPKGRLLIGDQAINFRQKHADEFTFWDLGEEWKKLVNLPFVYALWLVRPEAVDSQELANRLRALRDKNLTNLDKLIADIIAGVADSRGQNKLSREFLSRYYREHLRFSFGEKEKEGLRKFADLCTNHGVLPKRGPGLHVV